MTWSWQEWVVSLLIIVCSLRIVYGIYTFFLRAKKNDNPCASCASGCELKRQLDKKQDVCKNERKTLKKNCSK